jgi:molybdenum cofactor sulfurtransferase
MPCCLQALSYYKIFGYPTGLGALLVRRDAVQVLRKRFFGGGTVEVSVSNADFFRCQRLGHTQNIPVQTAALPVACWRRKEASHLMWLLADVISRWALHRRREGAAGLEDGTAHFLGIAALRHGFAAIRRAGGFPAVDDWTSLLARRGLHRISAAHCLTCRNLLAPLMVVNRVFRTYCGVAVLQSRCRAPGLPGWK